VPLSNSFVGYNLIMSDFSDWFTNKYLDWQRENGRGTVTAFAAYLGISQANASNYLRDASRPDIKNLQLIADKLGDEVYEKLGAKPPINDSRLRLLLDSWNGLSEAVREEIFHLVKGREDKVIYPVVKDKADGPKTRTYKK